MDGDHNNDECDVVEFELLDNDNGDDDNGEDVDISSSIAVAKEICFVCCMECNDICFDEYRLSATHDTISVITFRVLLLLVDVVAAFFIVSLQH